MELQIGTDEFSRALYRAQGIVEKKSTMPILASVLLEATEDGRLRVSAFDLEIGVTGTHPCEVRKGGAVALKVPAGTRAGQQLRLAGRGLSRPGEKSGDLFAIVAIVVPTVVNEGERTLFRQLSESSNFDPRAHFKLGAAA